MVFSSKTEELFDIAIIGAGPVGLSLAGWLSSRSAVKNLSIALIDERSNLTESLHGPYAIALSHGSRTLLNTLAWPNDVIPINQLHISQRGHFGRTLIDRDEYNLEALGYVVRYDSLVDALACAVKRTKVQLFTLTSVCSIHQNENSVILSLKTSKTEYTTMIQARIVVNANGGFSNKQHIDKKDRYYRNYRQTAIVGVVTVSMPRPNIAWERFTSEGSLALLPLDGPNKSNYAFFLCCSSNKAIQYSLLPDDVFLHVLGNAFGSRMGRFTAIIGRSMFPLRLSATKTLMDHRVVLIGNAAQTLHPIVGQGLNLGLRDARTFTDIFLMHGQEIALLSTLFNRRRALDRWFTIGATDVLARVFTIDAGPLSIILGAALTALEFLPPLKTIISRQMIFGQRI